MAAVPALAEAFKDSYAQWYGAYSNRPLVLGVRSDGHYDAVCIPAPLCDEMLVVLIPRLFGVSTGSFRGVMNRILVTTRDDEHGGSRAVTVDITDPSALARALLAACGVQP
jgi:hypothetical protein